MSHHAPFYATAPLGQTTNAPLATQPVATDISAPLMMAWRVTGMAAGAALAYHGYRRNNSVGWALAWAVGGGIVWPVALAIAFAQGFGRPSLRKNRGRRRRSR